MFDTNVEIGKYPEGSTMGKVSEFNNHADARKYSDKLQGKNEKKPNDGKVHKNDNDYIGDQSVYQITIDGELYKYGKTANGNPKRLETQLQKLKQKYPNSIVDGEVLYENSEISTKDIKKVETSKIQEYYDLNGKEPAGNQRTQD